MDTKRLSAASLPLLPDTVTNPTYDRSQVRNGIVHIGVGGFHRAHEAVYIDDLLQQGETDWGICGVGLLPHDQKMKEALVPQDGLYTVMERSAPGDTARIIGSLTRYLLAPDDPEIVLQTLASPQTRIVSLTITEGGYHFDPETDELRSDTPRSVFGYVTEALARRRRDGVPPFTLLSCDNLPQNGVVARETFLAYAALRDPALGDWIAQHVTFPSSMVDRITPQTTDADRQRIRDEFGVDDAWPVVCEPFKQWIIEDNFCNGRPALETVDAQFTINVHPYELMKLRLLNASHSAMGYLGYLAGYRLIPEVIADPLFQSYIAHLMDDEVTPLLLPVPGINLADYKQTLLTRFANPAIADQVQRICLDGSAKMPKFVLPSLQDALAQDRPLFLLVLAVAGWFRYLTGTDEQGDPIEIQDPLASELQTLARQGGPDPRPLLSLRRVFGDLGDNPRFVESLSAALASLYAVGARETLKRAVPS